MVKRLKEQIKTKGFWLRLAFVLVLTIGIPVLINESYKANKVLYTTVWSGAEFLTYYRWICSDCPEDKLVYCSWECEKHRREWLMKEHEMRIGSEFEKEWLQE